MDADEFWSEIFGASFEIWEWWFAVNYIEGDWDKAGTVEVIAEHEGSDELEIKRFTVEEIASAYNACLAKGLDVDIENMDACSSDLVIQMAMFGEIIYG
jgi:hypothetical protein